MPDDFHDLENRRDPREEAMMDVIESSLDMTDQAKYLVSLRRLPPGARSVWSTWIVQCEVENGGFAQYFWNMENEAFYEEAMKGFDLMGAALHRRCLGEALSMIRPHLPAMHTMQGQTDRFTKYKPLLKRTGIYDRLSDLNTRFYTIRPTLQQIRTDYIIRHPEAFKGRVEQ